MNSSFDKPATKATLLLVDDNAELLETMALLLELSGYKIYKAENAVEALEVVKVNNDIDIILTDVVMPGAIRSVDLAIKIKDISPNTEVVFTSGYTDTSAMLVGENSIFISKPYDVSDVDRVVQKVLKSRTK